ncbi:MAG: hypothetical protein R2826_09065 [Thermoleophilia bacterium]
MTAPSLPPKRRRSRFVGAIVLLLVIAGATAALVTTGRRTTDAPAAANADKTKSEATSTAAGSSSADDAVKSWRDVGLDRTLKADLVKKLDEAPELVVLGGSRAQRFRPERIAKITGLSAFNFAVHNCRPEDAYAISRYLYDRAPNVNLHCFFAVQATTFSDVTMQPALLYDPRFVRYFPASLVKAQKKANEPLKPQRVPERNKFSARGELLFNVYDTRSLERVLPQYIKRMTPKAASTGEVKQTRAHKYFEKLLKLYNDHGVTPAIVIMPYHPDVLAAFRAVGWEVKQDRLKAYLAETQKKYDFVVLDYTEIESFGGNPDWFYDGAHITRANSNLLFEQAVRDAPQCFR